MDISHADFPAPDGPIIKIFSVGRDSSDAIFGKTSCELCWKVVEGDDHKESKYEVQGQERLIGDVSVAKSPPSLPLRNKTQTCAMLYKNHGILEIFEIDLLPMPDTAYKSRHMPKARPDYMQMTRRKTQSIRHRPFTPHPRPSP